MIKIFSDENGIASAELLFVSLIFLILAGSLVNLIDSNMDRIQTGELAEVRMTGERIAGTINTVYTNGPGYSINLDLRGNVNYTAEVNSTGYVTMQYKDQRIPIRLIARDHIENITMNAGDRYKVYNNNSIIRFRRIG